MPKRMLETAQKELKRGARGAGAQARRSAGNACASARVLMLVYWTHLTETRSKGGAMPKRMLETAQKVLKRGARGAGAQARRSAGNACASARVLALSILASALMGVAGWAFLAALDMATTTRDAHVWLFALLPFVNVATAWLYRNHGLRAQRGNNLVIDTRRPRHGHHDA